METPRYTQTQNLLQAENIYLRQTAYLGENSGYSADIELVQRVAR